MLSRIDVERYDCKVSADNVLVNENSSKQYGFTGRTPLATIPENVPPGSSGKRSKAAATAAGHRPSHMGCFPTPTSLRCFESLVSPSAVNSGETSLRCDDRDDEEDRVLHLRAFWRSNLRPLSGTSFEVFFNQLAIENSICSLSSYLNNQPGITANMRGTLVEWIADVSHGCQQNPETLFMAVSYLDHYMASVKVTISTLQLVGITCLFVSSKLNDTRSPDIEDFAYVTENMYSVDDIIETERTILHSLRFRLIHPTVLNFSEFYYSYFTNVFWDSDLLLCVQALCELSLLDYALSNAYYPSVLGAAIVMIVSLYSPGNLKYEDFTDFKLDLVSIVNCHEALCRLLSSVDSLPFDMAIERFKLLMPSRVCECPNIKSPSRESEGNRPLV